jgi:hypothetical protein
MPWGALVTGAWHAPPGYRVVTTDERVASELAEDSAHLIRRCAERRAAYLNDHYRLIPTYEWRVVREQGLWRVVAFQNRLVAIAEAA